MKTVKKILLYTPIYIALGWVFLALSVELYILYLHFSGNDAGVLEFSKQLLSKLS